MAKVAQSISRTRRVAVIGAGSAGLGAAHELLSLSRSGKTDIQFEPVLFERRPKLGGIWQYDDPGECTFIFDSRGAAHPVSSLTSFDGKAGSRPWPPSPMYDGLRTNIPQDLMCFRDFPDEQQGVTLFPGRGSIEEYLKSFASRIKVENLIRYNADVISIRRMEHQVEEGNSPRSKWAVTSRTLDGRNAPADQEEFDYVVMASGRCNRPKVPFVPGLWLWKGKLTHSAWYRTPTIFRNQSVLIVGNNSSGMDIARELHGKVVRHFEGAEQWIADANVSPPRTGVKVRQSVEDVDKPPQMDYDPKDAESPEWSRRIEVVPRISRVEAPPSGTDKAGVIVLEDGSRLDDIDVIVFATGFFYEFPPLNQSVAPFDKHPVLQRPPPSNITATERSELDSVRSKQDSTLDTSISTRAAPFMSNLDDWQLFYAHDPSIVFLGIPTSIVPFPFAQIQARYAAYFWAGLVPPLPSLDNQIPVSDAKKWVSVVEDSSEVDMAKAEMPVQHLLGNPSEHGYLDQLLHRIQGSVDHSPVDNFDTDDVGGLSPTSPRGPEQSYQTTKWRRERRANGKLLRRKELGY
ncbi:hypothetical protein CF327_g3330 [Tilletia walkeri]|uniref:FAD/NAD(P)-binding domain-containing protein n=1 Tax=Tilletia walkeri TaxID=117179 RepID=A0A8X7T4X0_9BASI|nr:hypothetical protein CF327_g3330 [Tilletia walkeri]KAE8268589.1 hypothetical protein A4X09_0g3750 [Tilletia walkeri]